MSVLNMLSPGISIKEVDLTGIVPGVSTSVGAYCGEFNWGPVEEPMLIANELQLVSVFGKPTSDTSDSFVGTSFFSCANFLAYTNSLYVTRVVNANSALNASTSNTANKLLIKNREDYENSYLFANNQFLYGDIIAKYPGKKANGLKVSVCANTETFSQWPYRSYFDNAPSTSSYVIEATGNSSARDELHMVVIDSTGQFSGKANTILEKFAFASKARDAMSINGTSSFYKNVLNETSNYIYALDPIAYSETANTWGKPSTDVPAYGSPASNIEIVLNGGSDGMEVTTANLINGWDIINDKDRYEISLAFVGSSADKSITIPQHILDNIVLGTSSETPIIGRKDTMLFVSPRYNDVVSQSGFEISNIITNNQGFLRTFNRESSYIVADSGWKYQYDKYNNVYRWIPLNADIAGLCAYTDTVADSWYSPAGFNRGKIKNAIKLSWNPNQTQRDELYKNGVNPVISTTADGIVLLGDKTLQAKPSAFDRINVRRLFITLEKAISRAAKYSLFEFNDPFTRAQFVALIEPYLRTVQGRRGITAFKVICDESVNTPDIIDRNAFIAIIMVKPARSINFIELSFVAVRTGVEFTYAITQV
jgi:Phage tail sheath protein subtilisin-like domain/Phage tail sheath C-terminal domain